MTYAVNYGKVFEETNTLQELIILTLSHAFHAKPKQSAGIVPRDFKFLTVAVVKGKKRESTSIRKWYRIVSKTVKHFVDVILNDNPQRIESQIYHIMNIVKVGLFVKDPETIRLCIKCLYLIISEFTMTFYQGFFWEWFK